MDPFEIFVRTNSFGYVRSIRRYVNWFHYIGSVLLIIQWRNFSLSPNKGYMFNIQSDWLPGNLLTSTCWQEFTTEYHWQICLSVYSQLTNIYTFSIHKYKDISTSFILDTITYQQNNYIYIQKESVRGILIKIKFKGFHNKTWIHFLFQFYFLFSYLFQ